MREKAVLHPIPPIFDDRSELLILGSFPSVRSREESFFYAHPQNRFWRVLSLLLSEPLPDSVPEKRALLLRNRIALWDVVGSCKIVGSSDASIRDVRPNGIEALFAAAPIRAVYTNGKTAWSLYRKYVEPTVCRPAICLPSTSPANAACSLDRLCDAWRVILSH